MKKLCAIIAITLLAGCSLFKQEPRLPPRSDITPGQTITVEGNQNIYAVAREHNVSMRDLIVINNLQPPFTLRSGQTLTLPAGSSASGSNYYSANSPHGYAPAPNSAPSGSIESSSLEPAAVQSEALPPPASTPSAKNESRVNALPPAPVLPPPISSPQPPKQTAVDALNKPSEPPKPVATTVAPAPVTTTPAAPPANNLHTTAVPTSNAAVTAPANMPAPKADMVWPVQGPVLSAYGSKGQGLSNDGVNIGAPKGAPVVAAQNGIVVYAGNEMKGFGNLVLIRHSDGWVTAYAHLDRMLVNKDAVVAQGDMIGTVGKTGNVPSPQLHFETRFEGKPVDPSTVIKAQ